MKKYKIVQISDAKFDSFFYILFLLLTFTTQFYTHNYETLGWDINTFIVMSQEVHRGNLPYENHFDNKGPLLYFLYAIPTYFKSLIVVKIFNDYQFISNEYQIETILALHDHLILFYFDKIGENYIVHPSNYNKKSYVDNLIKHNFMEQ